MVAEVGWLRHQELLRIRRDERFAFLLGEAKTHLGLVPRKCEENDATYSELDTIPYQRLGSSREPQGERADVIDVDHGTTLALGTDSVLWAIVLGVLSVALFFPFGPVIGPFAIWLGRRGYRRATAGAPGRGLALTGLVLGVVGLAAGAVTWVAASACDCL